MRNLTLRVLTAVVAIPLALAIFWTADRFHLDWLVALFISVAALVASWEYIGLVGKLGIPLPKELFFFATPAFLLLLLPKGGQWAPVLGFAFIYLIVIYSFFRRGAQEGFFVSLAGIFGFLYIPVMLSFVYTFYKAGFFYVLHFLLLVWAYDSGAYLVGSTMGRHRLLPQISLAKTWEGVAGGTILACGAALLLPQFLTDLRASWPHALALGVVMSVFVQLGDLFESLVKRAAGVKDAGHIFPGHGGMLDRIDGLLAAAPIYFFYFHYILKFF